MGGFYNGSGVLISPNWVLTAAHMFLSNGAAFTVGGTTYTSDAVYADPGWNGNAFDSYNIGLIHLSTPVTGITPATIYTGSSEYDAVGTSVGYGMKGTGLTGYQSADNQKRAFQNVTDGWVTDPSLILASDFDSPHSSALNVYGDSTPLPLEGCVSPGDSGGGLFMSDASDNTYLIGITSFVASTWPDVPSTCVYGDISGYTRVTTSDSSITSISGVVGSPEPSSLAVAATGLVAAAAFSGAAAGPRSACRPPLAASSRTGPSKPESTSGESAVNGRQVVKVWRPPDWAARQQPFGPLDNIAGGLWLRPAVNVAGRPPFAVGARCSSPISGLAQRLTTSISRASDHAGAKSAHIDAERRLPKDAQVAAVEFDFSGYLDATQVQIGSPAGHNQFAGSSSDL